MNESNLIISVVALQTIVFHISFFFQINWNNYVKTFSGFEREKFSGRNATIKGSLDDDEEPFLV